MDDRYWLTIQSEQKGPYKLTQLQSMWRSGAITDDTLYWQEGFDEWIPLSIISDLLDPQPAPVAAPAQVPQHSTHNIAKPATKRSSGCAVLALIGIIGAVILFIASQSGSDRKVTDSGQAEGVIYRVTTRIVTKSLKSPSTAKFPSYYDDGAVTFTSLGNQRYSIRSYVDSQNSFGAMVRTHWTAIVSVTGETVHVEDFQTE